MTLQVSAILCTKPQAPQHVTSSIPKILDAGQTVFQSVMQPVLHAWEELNDNSGGVSFILNTHKQGPR